jgi:hypothetical protein
MFGRHILVLPENVSLAVLAALFVQMSVNDIRRGL